LPWKDKQESLKAAKCHLKVEVAKVFFMAMWSFIVLIYCQITSFPANSLSCFKLLHCELSLRELKLWFCWIVRNVLGLKFLFITYWVIFFVKKYLLVGMLHCVPWVDRGVCIFCECKFQHKKGCLRKHTVFWLENDLELIPRYPFEASKPKELRMASYEWEHCWVLKFVLVAG